MPFATRFRDFAVRNLNRDLSPRSPPDKRYVDLDRNFPDGIQPVPIEAGALTRNGRYQAAVTIQPLAARYFYFSPDFDARDVTFDLSGLSPPAVVDGDVLLYIAGRWERRPIQGSELRLCRDDRADDFEAAYLVLSNHGQETPVTGELGVRTRGSCGDLAGTITWSLTYEYSDPQLNNAHTLTSDTVSISVRMAGATGEWVDDGSSYAWGGTGLTTDYVDDCSRSTDNSTTVGGGAFDGEVAQIFVEVDHAAKTVFLSATVAGQLSGHKVGGSHVGSPGSGQCEIREDDYQQGGGSSVDSRAEWIQLVRCDNFGDGVIGKISADGKTVDFACTSTRTSDVNTGTATETFVVTGRLAFRNPGQ